MMIYIQLVDTPAEKAMFDAIKAQIVKDVEGMAAGKQISLLAKWLSLLTPLLKKAFV